MFPSALYQPHTLRLLEEAETVWLSQHTQGGEEYRVKMLLFPVCVLEWCLFFLCLSLFLQSLLSKASQPYSSLKISRQQRTLRFASAAANLITAPLVNVNPFTPDPVRRNSEQPWRNSCRSDDDDDFGRRYAIPPYYMPAVTIRISNWWQKCFQDSNWTSFGLNLETCPDTQAGLL